MRIPGWMAVAGFLPFLGCASGGSQSGAPAPITVGRDVLPEVVEIVKPEYPVEARAKALEGVVLMKVTIGPDGNVRNVAVARSDHKIFEEPALEAVAKWKFRPAFADGEAVTSTVMVPVKFEIEW